MTTRKSFSAQEKMDILNEGMQPGATAVEVCRKHGIGTSLYYKWKKDAERGMREAVSGMPEEAFHHFKEVWSSTIEFVLYSRRYYIRNL